MSSSNNNFYFESPSSRGWSPASSTNGTRSRSSSSDVEDHHIPSPAPERPARKSTRPARKSVRPPRKSLPASDLKALERAVADAKSRISKANARYATALKRKHEAEARMAAEKARRKAALEKQLQDLLAMEQEAGVLAGEMEDEADGAEHELWKLLQ